MAEERIKRHCMTVTKQNSLQLYIFFAFQVAREVMNFTGNVSVSLKPLADGLNFLSDAFFAEISHEKGVTNLFVKVILFMYSI